MMGVSGTWIWLKENWLYGAVAWLMFVLSLAVTVVFFVPVIIVLSLFGVDIGNFEKPFNDVWQGISMDTSNGRFVVFSLIFFPFVFRNFLRFAEYMKSLRPSDWDEI